MLLEKECITLEYKSSEDKLSKDLWETYSAFANTKGGKIILGVREKGKGKYEIIGVKNPETQVSLFWELIRNTGKVSNNILNEKDVVIKEIENKKIIEINVPEADYKKKPIYIDGNKSHCYVRVGEADRIATDEEFKNMILNSQDNIDDQLLTKFDLDDLNDLDILSYKNILYLETKEEKYKNMSTTDLLKEIGVLKLDRTSKSKEYKLTLGGLLFFGKYNSIIDFYPGFQLDYFRKHSSMDTDWIDRVSTGDKDYPELNVFSFYIKVLEKLTATIEVGFYLDNELKRNSYRNDISKALREALTNTLVHAYYGTNQPIKIINFDDFWEFQNPGKMLVSKQEFIHGGTSRVRNSVMSILFRRIGYAERAGSGGPRIFDATNRHQLKTPEILTSEVDTIFRIWKKEPINYYANRDETELLILEEILESNSITKKIAKEKLNLTEYKFLNTVDSLINDKIIERLGKGRNTVYVLKSTEESSIAQMKKILTHIRDSIIREKDHE